MRRNPVVITGIGIVAPNGIGIEAFWESILEGRSGIGPITSFDASDFKSRIAGEVKNFDPLKYMDAECKPKRLARHAQLAYAATQMALEDANFDPKLHKLAGVLPICVGVSTSAMDIL